MIILLYIEKASENKRNICNFNKFCVLLCSYTDIYIYIYIYIYISMIIAKMIMILIKFLLKVQLISITIFC